MATAKQRHKEEAALAAARARQQAAQQVALAQAQARRAAAFDPEAARRQHIAALATARGGKGDGRDAAAEKERALVEFKQLLLDKGVNGFSFFDKMVPKLQDDDRWVDVWVGGWAGRGKGGGGDILSVACQAEHLYFTTWHSRHFV